MLVSSWNDDFSSEVMVAVEVTEGYCRSVGLLNVAAISAGGIFHSFGAASHAENVG